MISDVLHEMREELERYQREQPDAYDSLRDEIDELQMAMRKLQEKLDQPP